VQDVDRYQRDANTKFDTVFAVDCGDVTRMGSLAQVFLDAKTSINIDHHKGNNNFGQLNVVDRYCSSTCQIMCELYLSNKILMDKKIATYLYIGLSTDTGNFMHSNVNYRVFGVAAILLGCGVDLDWVTTNLYRSNTKQRLKLLGYALSKIEYYCDDKVAILQINERDLQACGVDNNDTSSLVSYCIGTKGVVVAAQMTQFGNKYEVSFRSNSDLDVSIVATAFGGGGHKQAAGCVVDGSPAQAHQKVLRAMVDTYRL
jgi:phosphoesterase RecJ-like protein